MKKTITVLMLIIMTGFLSCDDGVLDTYDNSVVYKLRDIGPAGGWIFYINPNYRTDGWRYLEAAPFDQGTSGFWSTTNGLVGGTSAGIGTGAANTSAIVAWLITQGDNGRPAQLCNDLSITNNGIIYDDWFLPSKDELWQMCWNLKGLKYDTVNTVTVQNPDVLSPGIGGFVLWNYWSSSETDASTAENYHFEFGSPASSNKNGSSFYTRAIRAF